MSINLFGKPKDNLCGLCMKEILPGQAVYSIQDKNGRAKHWGCYQKHDPFKQLRESLNKRGVKW